MIETSIEFGRSLAQARKALAAAKAAGMRLVDAADLARDGRSPRTP
jgi:hypothetical protein